MLRNLGRRLGREKSIRAFAFEVLIVVVGVLIALGAQQLVEDWTWRQKVVAGEQRLKDEADGNAYALVEQLIIGPCVDAQLVRLDAKLRMPGPWKGTTTYATARLIPTVIRAPSRPIPTELWNTLGGEGTALHFDPERAMRTEGYYKQLQILVERTSERNALLTELNFLAQPISMSGDFRAGLLGKIGAIRYHNSFQSLVAVQLLGNLKALGRLRSLASLDAEIAEVAREKHGTIAVCRNEGLPLGDWKTVLRQRIADERAMAERLKSAPK